MSKPMRRCAASSFLTRESVLQSVRYDEYDECFRNQNDFYLNERSLKMLLKSEFVERVRENGGLCPVTDDDRNCSIRKPEFQRVIGTVVAGPPYKIRYRALRWKEGQFWKMNEHTPLEVRPAQKEYLVAALRAPFLWYVMLVPGKWVAIPSDAWEVQSAPCDASVVPSLPRKIPDTDASMDAALPVTAVGKKRCANLGPSWEDAKPDYKRRIKRAHDGLPTAAAAGEEESMSTVQPSECAALDARFGALIAGSKRTASDGVEYTVLYCTHDERFVVRYQLQKGMGLSNKTRRQLLTAEECDILSAPSVASVRVDDASGEELTMDREVTTVADEEPTVHEEEPAADDDMHVSGEELTVDDTVDEDDVQAARQLTVEAMDKLWIDNETHLREQGRIEHPKARAKHKKRRGKRVPLDDHQREAATFVARRFEQGKGSLLFHEHGTESEQTIIHALTTINAKSALRFLFVVRSAKTGRWTRSCRNTGLAFSVCENVDADNALLRITGSFVCFITHELFMRAFSRRNEQPSLFYPLMKHVHCVVVDDIDLFCNAWGRFAIKEAETECVVIGATASPIRERLMDAVEIATLVDPEFVLCDSDSVPLMMPLRITAEDVFDEDSQSLVDHIRTEAAINAFRGAWCKVATTLCHSQLRRFAEKKEWLLRCDDAISDRVECIVRLLGDIDERVVVFVRSKEAMDELEKRLRNDASRPAAFLRHDLDTWDDTCTAVLCVLDFCVSDLSRFKATNIIVAQPFDNLAVDNRAIGEADYRCSGQVVVYRVVCDSDWDATRRVTSAQALTNRACKEMSMTRNRTIVSSGRARLVDDSREMASYEDTFFSSDDTLAPWRSLPAPNGACVGGRLNVWVVKDVRVAMADVAVRMRRTNRETGDVSMSLFHATRTGTWGLPPASGTFTFEAQYRIGKMCWLTSPWSEASEPIVIPAV